MRPVNLSYCFFLIVKERQPTTPAVDAGWRNRQYADRRPLHTGRHSPDWGLWWRMTGSNRRPPACKAGALPAELIPRMTPPEGIFIAATDGGSGWIRTSDPRLIKTVL